jgi:hypothetical protein
LVHQKARFQQLAKSLYQRKKCPRGYPKPQLGQATIISIVPSDHCLSHAEVMAEIDLFAEASVPALEQAARDQVSKEIGGTTTADSQGVYVASKTFLDLFAACWCPIQCEKRSRFD